MSTPTVVQLIAAIRGQLTDVVAPSVQDPGAGKVLAMIDHLLQTVEVRAENEIDWMVTHVAEINDLANRFVDQNPGSEEIAAARQRFVEHEQRSLTASSVTANYALAAAVLSEILEATVSDDGPLARRARELLRRDVAHGVDVVGEFVLVPP